MSTLTIFVDGRPCRVTAKDTNLLQACLSLGFDLPYFCWHPALHSVGACRQCAVKVFKDEKDAAGRIVMACMTPVSDGMRVSIDDPEARAFRGQVTEWLMINHPHDCPVCDEGGECHLQDMTVMTGHTARSYRFSKRTHRNQDLGPFLSHEMNRCIQCYRCVRFYRDVAGGRDLEVLGRHDNVYFGRHADGALESEFSGNLVEVCPTGVFTDRSFRSRFARKWDLQTAPSVCPHCGVGCNTLPGERYGVLRRVRNRYNGEVNGYFLCDRGRYGFDFANSPRRLRAPLARAGKGSAPSTASGAECVSRVAGFLREGRVIGIGSPRASLETNFALRDLVGEESFFHGVPDSELSLLRLMAELLRQGPAPSASLADARAADAVLVLGEDALAVAPLLGLSVRQAAFNEPGASAMARTRAHLWEASVVRRAAGDQKGPVFLAAPWAIRLEDCAEATYLAAPADIARLGFAVANRIDPTAPAVSELPEEAASLAGRIAGRLASAQNPLVVSGPTLGSADTIRAAANVAWALSRTGKNARLCYAVPECNSMGVALMPGKGLDSAREYARTSGARALVVVENDLLRRISLDRAEELFAGTRDLVVIDHILTRTGERADVLLPAASFAEASGTLVNAEGRAQRFFSVLPPAGQCRESWRWLGEVRAAAGKGQSWVNLDSVLASMADEIPSLREAVSAAPSASARVAGQRVPRQAHRASGRTAVNANVELREAPPSPDLDSPLAFSMEGYEGRPPSPLIARFWSPGWNSDQALNKFQAEVGGPLLGGDPGRRLLEPSEDDGRAYNDGIPGVFERIAGEWLILPLHEVFGSEELSALAPSVSARSPSPRLMLCAEDAERLGLREGGMAEVAIEGRPAFALPVAIREMPAGVAGLSIGFPETVGILLPAKGWIASARRGGA